MVQTEVLLTIFQMLHICVFWGIDKKQINFVALDIIQFSTQEPLIVKRKEASRKLYFFCSKPELNVKTENSVNFAVLSISK